MTDAGIAGLRNSLLLCALLAGVATAPLVRAQSIPSPDVLRKFSEFEAQVELGQADAFVVADDLLATAPDADMRLTIGRLALQAGQAQRAVDYLTPLVTPAAFDPVDPRATDVLDLLSDAYRALGQMAQAMQFDLLAFNAAEARLGPENSSLLQRLARIEQRYDPLPPQLAGAGGCDKSGVLAQFRRARLGPVHSGQCRFPDA